MLVVDAGEPRNAPARGAHNLLAREGTGPFDELPEVIGVRKLWGKSVLHCPYCHGWEVRGKRIGVLGTSAMSVHQTLLFRQLSDRATLFLHSMADAGAASDQLAALNVQVVSGIVDRLHDENGVLEAVILAGGREFPIDALAVAPRFIARAELYEQLGGSLTEHPMGAFIATEQMGRTPIPGV